MKYQNISIPFAAFVLQIAMICGHGGHHHHDHHDHHDILAHSHEYDRNLEEKITVCDQGDLTAEQMEHSNEKYREWKNNGITDFIFNTEYIINVHWHTVTSGTTGATSAELINRQMAILNKAFNGEASEYAACSGFSYGLVTQTNFRFNLVEVSTYDDSQAFNLVDTYAESFRHSTRVGNCQDLNIWTGGLGGGLLGRAFFPEWCPNDENDPTGPFNPEDGVIIDYRTMPDNGYSNYDEGDVLVHEVGHWVGLWHTFQGGCSATGDEVADTPAEASPSSGCPIGRDSCSADGVDPIHNFMNYVYNCCMYTFTQGQADRMAFEVNYYRGIDPTPIGPTISPRPTPSPTQSPTSSPTISAAPTLGPDCSCASGEFKYDLELLTDTFPGETSWTLQDSNGTVISSVSGYSSPGTTYTDSQCLSVGCYTYTLNDGWGDGICCSVGEGHYTGTLHGRLLEFSGGEFDFQVVHSFCGVDVCSTTSSPTAPTSAPTSASTPAPTPAPTSASTPPPTQAPTPPPTLAPTTPTTPASTSAPTSASTPPPTQAPTPPPTPASTSAPTPLPTQAPTSLPTPLSPTPTPSPTSSPPTDDPWLIDNTQVSHQLNIISVSHDIYSGPQGFDLKIYDGNCQQEIDANGGEIVSIDSSNFIPGDNINYDLRIDESRISNSTLVSFDDDTTESAGSISFCTSLSTSLSTETSEQLPVASKKLIFTVDFDFSNVAFTLPSIQISEDNTEVFQLSIDFAVSACECGSDFECVDPLSSSVYSQGDTAPEFRVCVTPADSATPITNLELTLESDKGYEYDCVEFGTNGPILDALTTLTTKGDTTMITTRLVQGLFNNGASSVNASGKAFLSMAAGKDSSEILEYQVTILLDGKTVVEKDGCLQKLISRFLKY